ncbi:putative glucan endo-1,3-beta-glucosidase BG5 [Cardamine amara subsp. amara]|uniref:glucan endo-1,3-beta-D-glucosidase n=1 Tax=Cardamine amara subsp. amara TaxID=228776 RepID=A0ABD0Z374_CARAN
MDYSKKLFVLLLSCMTLIFNYNNIYSVSAAASVVGLNYGLLGNNLPSPSDVIKFYKSQNVVKIRIFEPNKDILEALRGNREIGVIVGIKNEDLKALAANKDAVKTWFATNIDPYVSEVNITFITVGNQAIPGDENGPYVFPVMQSLTNIVKSRNLPILISTTITTTSLAALKPPSAAVLTPLARKQLFPVLKLLSLSSTPILVNIYPYYFYVADPKNVPLEYANFNTDKVVVKDGSLSYTNMFDAIFDGFLWAMEKEEVRNVPLVVSETGWPSAGNGDKTTPALQYTYNGNFVKHVASGKGTPKRPNSRIDGYIFETYNENQKPDGIYQHFGLFDPTA